MMIILGADHAWFTYNTFNVLQQFDYALCKPLKSHKAEVVVIPWNNVCFEYFIASFIGASQHAINI